MVKDSEKFSVVKSMSRENDRSELARGPLIYSLVMIFSAVFGWRCSPEAIVTICALCVGDGLADPIGRRFGKNKLYPGSKKSWEGSIFGMFLGSWISSWFFLTLFAHFGYFSPLVANGMKLAVISLACTLIEAIPTAEIDNLTIPLTAIIGTKLLLL
jgi:dolichol kinase